MVRFLMVGLPLVLAVVLLAALRAPRYDYTSRYLTMRDGVRIAVDLYLPRGLRAGTLLPAILHQTRYFRRDRVAWPFGLFWAGHLEPMIARYVASGYAYVVVDARGSGASFGTRSQEWSPEEVRDGAQVADWIVAQRWSSGRIGTTGVSYDATAAEFLLSTVHPAVRAAALRSGLYDAYTDVAFPGGVRLAPFIEFWSRMTSAQDRNDLTPLLGGIARLLYRGATPVQGDKREALLAAAVREHLANYNMARAVGAFEFSDETGQVRAMSPYTKRALVQESGAAIYSFSGWYDGALAEAAIKRFLSVSTPGSRLILGPWSHQGENLSPFAARLRDFDQTAESIRFFDYHLMGKENGIDREAAVRYYTVGEERWKTAHTWPPPGTISRELFLGANGVLSEAAPADPKGSDVYRVDLSTGSGQETRWNNLTQLDQKHSLARDRRERDRRLLVYTSKALDSDLEVTGHPAIALFLESTETDGALFVYLEDVDPAGEVRYATEGALRLLHRQTRPDAAPYVLPVPFRTFAKGDAAPLVPGQIARVEFGLFPISYLFRAGHAIRVAIAGADADHFSRVPARAPVLTIHRDATHRSHLALPVMPR